MHSGEVCALDAFGWEQRAHEQVLPEGVAHGAVEPAREREESAVVEPDGARGSSSILAGRRAPARAIPGPGSTQATRSSWPPGSAIASTS